MPKCLLWEYLGYHRAFSFLCFSVIRERPGVTLDRYVKLQGRSNDPIRILLFICLFWAPFWPAAAQIDLADPPVDVYFWVSTTYETTYTAHILLKNNSDAPIEDWMLEFQTDSEITDLTYAFWSSNGSNVLVRARGFTYRIRPGESVWFNSTGIHDGDPAVPDGCRLNGSPCTFKTDVTDFDHINDTPDPEGIKIEYTSIWDGGFVANMTITNNGPETIQGWTVAFDFPVTIHQVWNGVSTADGFRYTVSNEGWNRKIPPGESRQFGFEGTYDTTIGNPANCSFNGSACPIDASDYERGDPTKVQLSFRYLALWDGGYTAHITLVNHGDVPVTGWTLGFRLALPITAWWNARGTTEDGKYVFKDAGWNRTIEPGDSVDIGLQGPRDDDALPEPSGCRFMGEACAFDFDTSGRFLIATSVEEPGVAGTPSEQALNIGIYPNPFYSQATVSFQTENTQWVDIELLDLLGRRQEQIYAGPAVALTPYQWPVDGEGLPSGLYFVRSTGASGWIVTHPVLITK